MKKRFYIRKHNNRYELVDRETKKVLYASNDLQKVIIEMHSRFPSDLCDLG